MKTNSKITTKFPYKYFNTVLIICNTGTATSTHPAKETTS